MDDDEQFGEIVDVCIHAFRVITENGTPEMKILARVLLFELGKEAVKRAIKEETSTREGQITKQ